MSGIKNSQNSGSQDRSTGASTMVEYEHHEVHSGSAYETTTYNTDLDSGDKLIMAFKTPDTTKEIHMVAAMRNSSESIAYILEAPTITDGTGTEQVVYNKNRNSTKKSGVLSIEASPVVGEISVNPTITADGIVLEADGIGAGKEKGVSEARGSVEFVLKRNTVYAFRITGLVDNGNASIRLSWYEHTPKN